MADPHRSRRGVPGDDSMPRSSGTSAVRRPPKPKGRLRAFGLALLMHGLLIAMLFVGIRWQTSAPEGVAAELWEPPAPDAATKAEAPKVEPEPQPKPEPKPEPPKVEPPPAPAPLAQAQPEPTPQAKPDIVLEQERKAREEAERRAEEQRRQLEARKRAEEKARQEAEEKARLAAEEKERLEAEARAKREAEAKAKQEAEAKARQEAEAKAEREAEAKAKQEAEAKARREAEAKSRQEAEAKARREAEAKARQEAEAKARREAEARARQEAEAKARREAQEKAQREREEKQRAQYLERLREQAGSGDVARLGSATGTQGSAGSGIDSGYAARLSGLIRSNTIYQVPPDLAGNPKAVFLVAVSPDCRIRSVQLRRSSGVAAWDAAAERGIERTDPLPRQADGTCPSELEITRGPKDDR